MDVRHERKNIIKSFNDTLIIKNQLKVIQYFRFLQEARFLISITYKRYFIALRCNAKSFAIVIILFAFALNVKSFTIAYVFFWVFASNAKSVAIAFLFAFCVCVLTHSTLQMPFFSFSVFCVFVLTPNPLQLQLFLFSSLQQIWTDCQKLVLNFFSIVALGACGEFRIY